MKIMSEKTDTRQKKRTMTDFKTEEKSKNERTACPFLWTNARRKRTKEKENGQNGLKTDKTSEKRENGLLWRVYIYIHTPSKRHPRIFNQESALSVFDPDIDFHCFPDRIERKE